MRTTCHSSAIWTATVWTATVLAITLAHPFTASAQEHPAIERGFAADKLYQFEKLDQVNLFNGTLSVRIPIGDAYPVAESLSYGLTLTYSSKFWEFDEIPVAPGTAATLSRPNRLDNAGAGWRVSLGQVLKPDHPSNDTQQWQYVSPDGTVRGFFQRLHHLDIANANVSYSVDSSYLRMKAIANGKRTVEFPNGHIHTFNADGLLERMADRFGNTVQVLYGANTWTLRDDHGRDQVIHFQSATSDGFAYQLVDKIDLTAFGNTTATYDFDYTYETIHPACTDTAREPTTASANLAQLESVTLPDGTRYVFDYTSGACDSGSLASMTLPTLGRIDYTYRSWELETPGCVNEYELPWARKTPGIHTRTFVHSDGTSLGSWSYLQWLAEKPSERTGRCEGDADPHQISITRASDPLGHYTDHYFSVWPNVIPVETEDGFKGQEYGLPINRLEPDATGTRFLSSRTYDCDPDDPTDPRLDSITGCLPVRSTYLRYDWEQPCQQQDLLCQDSNRRVASRRTLYEDDANHIDVDSSSFDGLGHYRTVEVSSSITSAGHRTLTTHYNPGRTLELDDNMVIQDGYSMLSAASPWVLGTYTHQDRVEALQEARSPDSEEPPGTDEPTIVIGRVETAFDPNTGFLECQRRLTVGTERRDSDVLEVFVPDGDGNVVLEKSYGGDGQGLATGQRCDLVNLPAAPEYQWRHEYTDGVRSKTVVQKCCDTDPGSDTDIDTGQDFLTVVDYAVDTNTGLPSVSRDPSGLQTAYTFDALGRPTAVVPPDAAATVYTYTNASASAAATVDVVQRFNGNDLTTRSLLFDGLGRLCREKIRMPGNNQWSRQDFLYEAQGWPKTITERIAGQGGNTCATNLAPLDRTLNQRYDPFGRVRRITPPDGGSHRIDIAYLGERQITRTVRIAAGAAGQEVEVKTQERYDPHGRLVKVIEDHGDAQDGATPVETSYAYNVDGGLREVVQGGQTRTFSTDRRGFLDGEAHPELGTGGGGGGSVAYTLDSRGNILTKNDGVRTLTYVYDPAERVVQIKRGDDLQKEFSYHRTNRFAQGEVVERRAGKLYQAKRHNRGSIVDTTDRFSGSDLIVTETYRYEGRGGRVSERQTRLSNRGKAAAFTTGFTWDALGNLAAIDYPSCVHGCDTDPDRVITNRYNQGLLEGVTDSVSSSGASSITYHPNGLVNRISHTNGVTVTHGRDPRNMARPASITIAGPSINNWTLGGGAGTFTYDGVGNIKSIGNDTYRYDRYNRLVHANLNNVGQTQAYTYDRFGNITQVTTNGIPSTITVQESSNRLTGATYDPAGNLTQQTVDGQLQILGHDPFDMLQTLSTPTVADGYVYTADDQRLVEIDFTQDPWKETWSIRGLDGQVLRQYEHRDDGAGAETWTWTKDYIHRGAQLLASVSPNEGARHFHLDHLGTTRMITGVNGFEASRHTYFPFGEEVSNPGNEPMKFTGHERDANGPGTADDLDYMHARYYSPGMCRFLSVDRVLGTPKNPQSWNRFAYVHYNPVNRVDPDGNVVETAVDLGFVAYDLGDIIVTAVAGEQVTWGQVGNLGLSVLGATVPFLPAAVLRGASKADDVVEGAVRVGDEVASGLAKTGDEISSLASEINPKILAQLEKQLQKDGAASIHKALRSAERTLQRHHEKLPNLEFKSQVKGTIRNVESQIVTLRAFIKENKL